MESEKLNHILKVAKSGQNSSDFPAIRYSPCHINYRGARLSLPKSHVLTLQHAHKRKLAMHSHSISRSRPRGFDSLLPSLPPNLSLLKILYGVYTGSISHEIRRSALWAVFTLRSLSYQYTSVSCRLCMGLRGGEKSHRLFLPPPFRREQRGEEEVPR